MSLVLGGVFPVVVAFLTGQVSLHVETVLGSPTICVARRDLSLPFDALRGGQYVLCHTLSARRSGQSVFPLSFGCTLAPLLSVVRDVLSDRMS